MHPKDRQKMCTSCDGRIPLDAQVCPYCTAEQTHDPLPQGDFKELRHQSLQDSLTKFETVRPLYPPPYVAAKSTEFAHQASSVNTSEPNKGSMVEKRFNSARASLGVPTIPTHSSEEQPVDGGKSSFWPIMLLSLGANLLTLGLLQLLFSDQGFLRLEWNSKYWFLYCLGALPLFFLGFKKVNSMKIES